MKLSLLFMIQIGAMPTTKTLISTKTETFDKLIEKILEEIKSLSTLKTSDSIPKASDPFDQVRFHEDSSVGYS